MVRVVLSKIVFQVSLLLYIPKLRLAQTGVFHCKLYQANTTSGLLSGSRLVLHNSRGVNLAGVGIEKSYIEPLFLHPLT